MKQKKLFNFKLYMEGIRQLRTFGILSLVIHMFFAILIPVGNYLSQLEELKWCQENASIAEFSILHCDAFEYQIYMMILVFIVAPVMVLSLFQFLNKREDSDFYHSLPHTRVCLYNSYALSIITWIAGIALANVCVTAICYTLAKKYIYIDLLEVITFNINIVVLSLLIVSVFLLACSLCGNLMTTISVFLMIMFMPKIIFYIYYGFMNDALPFLTSSMLSIFATKNHLLYVMFRGVFSGEYGGAVLSGATVYTLVVAVLMYLAGIYVFKIRKSETSGMAMNSHTLQTAFRTLFTTLICFLPITMIFEIYLAKKTGETDELTSMIVFYIVVTYIIALVGMFVYELLTTKSVKNAFRSFRSLPLIAGINIAIIGLLIFSYNHYSSLRLDSKDYKAISFALDDSDYNYYDYYYYGGSDYFSFALSSYEFTDETIIEFMCDSFNDYAERITEKKDDENDEWVATTTFPVTFHGKTNRTYYVQFYDSDLTTLYKSFENIPELKEAYTTLPELTSKDTIYMNQSSIGAYPDSTADLKAIYNVLREELKSGEIDFPRWYSALQSQDIYDNDAIASLYVELNRNGTYYYFTLPISDATPETLEYFFQSVTKNHANDLKGFENSLTAMENAYESGDLYYSGVYIQSFEEFGHSNTTDSYMNFYDYDQYYNDSDTIFTSEERELFDTLLAGLKPLSEYEEGDVYILINSYYDVLNNYADNYYLFSISEETYQSIYQQWCKMN